MQFVLRLGAALLVAAIAIPCLADDLKPVSCSGFAIVYNDPVSKQECAEADTYGNQTEVAYKRLNAETDSYFLTVFFAEGKFRTYFPMRPLRAQIDDSHYFSDTDNWLDIRKFGGFEVAVFEGYEKAGSAPTLCAAFSRYSGSQANNYEFDGGPGFPHHTVGLYCAFKGQAALLNPPDNFYRVVQDALGKLQMPQ
jgi:hypothetical protein